MILLRTFTDMDNVSWVSNFHAISISFPIKFSFLGYLILKLKCTKIYIIKNKIIRNNFFLNSNKNNKTFILKAVSLIIST